MPPLCTCFLCIQSFSLSLVDSRNTAPINICDKDQSHLYPRQLNKACQTNPEIMINQTTVGPRLINCTPLALDSVPFERNPGASASNPRAEDIACLVFLV